MRIAFISADHHVDRHGTVQPGGSGWVRMHQPAQALEQYGGHEVLVGVGVAGHRTGALIPLDHENRPLTLQPTDVVVLQRWMHRLAPAHIAAAKAFGQVVINDIDDHFDRLHQSNRAWYSTHPQVDPEVNREHYAAAIAASDVATVSTAFLAGHYKAKGARVRTLRNMIDVPMFARQPVRRTGHGLVVGWVGATPWRSGDLETLAEVLPAFLEQVDGTFVHHGTVRDGDTSAYDLLGIPEHRRGPARPMLPVLEYPENLSGFDIGIVPLSDHPFNRAKSAIKGMEYAAAGIPFVAARTPEYERFTRGRCVAHGPEQWMAALRRLIHPDARQEAADYMHGAVQLDDIRRRWRDWEKAYEDEVRRASRRGRSVARLPEPDPVEP